MMKAILISFMTSILFQVSLFATTGGVIDSGGLEERAPLFQCIGLNSQTSFLVHEDLGNPTVPMGSLVDFYKALKPILFSCYSTEGGSNSQMESNNLMWRCYEDPRIDGKYRLHPNRQIVDIVREISEDFYSFRKVAILKVLQESLSKENQFMPLYFDCGTYPFQAPPLLPIK